MLRVLQAGLKVAHHSGDVQMAVQAAAEAVAHDPWRVIQEAGHLARAQWIRADQDLGLTASLTTKPIDHPQAIVQISKGSLFPCFDRQGRRKRGAFDTPKTMAISTVAGALKASSRPIQNAMDPAAGTGTFLLAMAELGVKGIRGIELDPLAACVASIAVPQADITVGSGIDSWDDTDLLVGNPPFVSPERQDKTLRTQLKGALPWLRGRYDLAVPFAALAVERVRPGGGVGLILPAALMVQPYAKPLRTQWIQNHRISGLSRPTAFPGAQVAVICLHMEAQTGPCPLPDFGLTPESLLSLDGVPLQAALQPGDPEIVAHIRQCSFPLGDLATIDTGVVSHGKLGSKSVLLHTTATPERVPYVDAKDLADNRTLWLDYQPENMHRPKTPALFSNPKVLVQRLRGRGPIRAWVDRSGLFAGHTLTVVRPDDPQFSPEDIHRLITDPIVDGLLRMERGARLDLYPKDVRSIPVPKAWKNNPNLPLQDAWDLTKHQVDRLMAFSVE